MGWYFTGGKGAHMVSERSPMVTKQTANQYNKYCKVYFQFKDTNQLNYIQFMYQTNRLKILKIWQNFDDLKIRILMSKKSKNLKFCIKIQNK